MPLSFDPDWQFATEQGPALSFDAVCPAGADGDVIDLWVLATGGTAAPTITPPVEWSQRTTASTGKERIAGFRRYREAGMDETPTFTFSQSSGFGWLAFSVPAALFYGRRSLASMNSAGTTTYNSPALDPRGIVVCVARQNDPGSAITFDALLDNGISGYRQPDDELLDIRTLDDPISSPSPGDYMHASMWEETEPGSLLRVTGSAGVLVNVRAYGGDVRAVLLGGERGLRVGQRSDVGAVA